MSDTQLIAALESSRTFAVAYERHLNEMPEEKTKADVLHYAYGLALAEAVQDDPVVKRAVSDWIWESVHQTHGQ